MVFELDMDKLLQARRNENTGSEDSKNHDPPASDSDVDATVFMYDHSQGILEILVETTLINHAQ
jgi:hypothetical protein